MPTRIVGSGLADSKALTVDQFFQYLEQLTDEPTKTKLYQTVSWVYRCIELRANNLAAIPYKILRGETEIQDNYPIEFADLLWELEADMCIYGAGYWLKDRPNVTKELQRLNPSTMRVLTSPTDPTAGIIGFEQQVKGKETRFKPEQMVYYRYYHPEDDLGPGVSPLQVACQAADLAYNANVWASQFFSHGAIPAVILHTEQMIPDSEQERVKDAWTKLTMGAKRAWRTIVLRKGLKPEVIGQPIKDLAMNELFDQIRTQVASAFGVPETMIADAANYATAKEHRLSFYQDTVIPKADQIQHALNRQLFEAQGLEFVFQFDQIEAIQKDEAEKAEYMRMLVDGKIITKDEARAALGYEPMDAAQEEELKPPAPDLTPNPQNNPQNPQPDVEPDLNQKVWKLGDTVVVTREWLDDAVTQKELFGYPVIVTDKAAPGGIVLGYGDDLNQKALEAAVQDDLRKWEKKALSKGANAPFESEFIPDSMRADILASLALAETEEEVRAAFAAPFRQEAERWSWDYP